LLQLHSKIKSTTLYCICAKEVSGKCDNSYSLLMLSLTQVHLQTYWLFVLNPTDQKYQTSDSNDQHLFFTLYTDPGDGYLDCGFSWLPSFLSGMYGDSTLPYIWLQIKKIKNKW